MCDVSADNPPSARAGRLASSKSGRSALSPAASVLSTPRGPSKRGMRVQHAGSGVVVNHVDAAVPFSAADCVVPVRATITKRR